MDTTKTLQVNMNLKTVVSFLLLITLLLFISTYAAQAQSSEPAKAETTAAKTETKKGNKAMKMVFSELKKEESILPTIAMIVGVIAIVGVAMYISFRDPSPEGQKG